MQVASRDVGIRQEECLGDVAAQVQEHAHPLGLFQLLRDENPLETISRSRCRPDCSNNVQSDIHGQHDDVRTVVQLILSARNTPTSLLPSNLVSFEKLSRSDAEQISRFATPDWEEVKWHNCSARAVAEGIDSEFREESFTYITDVPSEDEDSRDILAANPFANLAAWLWYLLVGVIRPDGWFRTRWDLLIALLLICVSITLPFSIAFDVSDQYDSSCPPDWPGVNEAPPEYNNDKLSAMQIAEYVIDACFVLDIGFNFRTAFYGENQKLVVNRKQISMTYLKSWFLLDAVSVIPFDILLTSPSFGLVSLLKSTRLIKLAKILRLMKIVKMLRLLRLPRIFKTLEAVVGRAFLSLSTFMFASILICHFTACIFYYVAAQHAYFRCTPNWIRNSDLQITDKSSNYITALYWALSTMTTVGYGDVVPGNSAEKIVSMFGMVLGVTVFAYFTGSMSSMMSAMQRENAVIASQKEMVEDFIQYRKVPPSLAMRMRNFYNYVLVHSIHEDENAIIAGLSHSLRPKAFIIQLVSMLTLEHFAPGDVVIRQGECGDCIFIVAEGQLEVRQYVSAEAIDMVADVLPRAQDCGSGSEARRGVSARAPSHSPLYRKLATLQAASFFGEYGCLTGLPRTATVVATQYVESYALFREDLELLLEDWPEALSDFTNIAEQLRSASPEELEEQLHLMHSMHLPAGLQSCDSSMAHGAVHEEKGGRWSIRVPDSSTEHNTAGGVIAVDDKARCDDPSSLLVQEPALYTEKGQ